MDPVACDPTGGIPVSMGGGIGALLRWGIVHTDSRVLWMGQLIEFRACITPYAWRL